MKNFISTIIILLFFFQTNAQTGFTHEFRSVNPFPVSGNSHATLLQTIDSCYLAIYNVNDTASGNDLYLVKMNWNGFVLWEKKIELPTYLEKLQDAAQMPDSTINILCTYDIGNLIYDEEVYFVKVDLNGNLLTTDFVTGSGICCWNIADGRLNLDKKGRLLFTHRYFGISFSDGLVYVLDTNYNYIYGAQDGNALYHATAFQDADSNYFSFGHESVNQLKRAVFFKRDKNFTFKWQRFFRPPSINLAKSNNAVDAIRIDSGFVLLMYFEDTNAVNNMYIVKTNQNGDSLTSFQYPNESYPFGIYSLGVDGYIVAANNVANGNSMELIRLDSAFNIIARQKYRYKNFNEWCYSFKQSSDGYYLLAGNSDSVVTRNIHVLKIKSDLCIDPSPAFSVNYNTGYSSSQAAILIQNNSDYGILDSANTVVTIDFGDGTVLNFIGDTISHLYTSQGTYLITLTVTTPCGTKLFSKQVVVPCTGQPTAFTYTTNLLTLNVAYNHTASTYQWSFGDGGTASTQTAVHSYANNGTYYVCLNTDNTCGAITICDSVAVECTSPFIPLPLEIKACIGTQVILDAENTGSNFLWSDGQTTQQGIFTTAGIYTVTVTNICGVSSSTSVDIQFSALPLVDIGTDSIVCLNELALFSNYASTNNYVYQWNIDNQFQGIGPTFYFIQSSLGLYHVTLLADNNGCVDSSSRDITVSPQLFCDTASYCIPTYTTGTSQGDYIRRVGVGTINNITGGTGQPAYVDYTNLTTTLTAGQSVTLTLDFNVVHPMYYKIWIDYNQDGVFSTGEVLTSNAANSGVSTTFTSISSNAYGGPTRMRVRCASNTSSNIDPCVNYNYGQTEDYTINILNGFGAPIAQFASDTMHIPVNGIVNFTDLSYNNPTAWEWTFTGAATTTSNLQNPTNIIYPVAGCYPITLKAINTNGFSIRTDTCYIFVDLVLNVVQQNFSNDHFSVQPNPFANSFTLNYIISNEAVAEICDVIGRTIKIFDLKKEMMSQSIDMMKFSGGVYNLTIKSNQSVLYTCRLIKTE